MRQLIDRFLRGRSRQRFSFSGLLGQPLACATVGGADPRAELQEIIGRERAATDEERQRAWREAEDYPLPMEVVDGVAHVQITGLLIPAGGALWRRWGGNATDYQEITAAVTAAKDDANVRAIQLGVDSVGGFVRGISPAVDAIWAARQVKPVQTHCPGVAASCAYHLGCQGARFSADRNAMVGGIGEFIALVDASKGMASEGIEVVIIRAGEHKGVGIFGAEITESHRKALKQLVDDGHELFIRDVLRGRQDLSRRQLLDVADGRAFYAERAQRHGLIDAVETERQSLEVLMLRLEDDLDQPVDDRDVDPENPKGINNVGEQLASLLNDRIDELETDERPRADIVEEMAQAAGIDAGTVNQILEADIDCPPQERLESFAEVLDVSTEDVLGAAGSDGCEYGRDDEDDGPDDENERRSCTACGSRKGEARMAKKKTAPPPAAKKSGTTELERLRAELEAERAKNAQLEAKTAKAEAAAEMARLSEESAKEERLVAIVEAHVKAGRIAPAQRDKYVELAKRGYADDAEGLDELLGTFPEVIKPGRSSAEVKQEIKESPKVDPSDATGLEKMAQAMGCTVEDLVASDDVEVSAVGSLEVINGGAAEAAKGGAA